MEKSDLPWRIAIYDKCSKILAVFPVSMKWVVLFLFIVRILFLHQCIHLWYDACMLSLFLDLWIDKMITQWVECPPCDLEVVGLITNRVILKTLKMVLAAWCSASRKLGIRIVSWEIVPNFSQINRQEHVHGGEYHFFSLNNPSFVGFFSTLTICSKIRCMILPSWNSCVIFFTPKNYLVQKKRSFDCSL